MRFVQSSQRRRCANSCSRMTFRSWAGSSRNAQAGRTMVRFQKPMAAGTRTYSEVAIVIDLETIDADVNKPDVTDPDAPIASTVFRTAGSRSAAKIGVQLRRRRLRRQNPAAKRLNATDAPTAQAKQMNSAQRPVIVIAGRRLPHEFTHAVPDGIPEKIPDAVSVRPSAIPPSTGNAATASNARNQAANRVPEFCLRKTRSNAQAKIAIRNPSGSELRIRSTEICATI